MKNRQSLNKAECSWNIFFFLYGKVKTNAYKYIFMLLSWLNLPERHCDKTWQRITQKLLDLKRKSHKIKTSKTVLVTWGVGRFCWGKITVN